MNPVPFDETRSELSPYRYDQLEAGKILFFARMLIKLPEEDHAFLMSQRLAVAPHHKNIAYRPSQDAITGVARRGDQEILHRVMRNFSQQACQHVSRMLARYAGAWKVGFASFRPFEEKNRHLSIHARNDLLHFDSFPTRPTHGDRILRFFVNLNPVQPRVWITGESFDDLAPRFASEAGLAQITRRATSPIGRQLARIGSAVRIPQLGRPPYDAFMHRFHNHLKENNEFQQNCAKQRWEFPPHSCWLLFTDMVSHAVLSGQLALEQTFIVPRSRMLYPERAPAAVLERLAGRALV